MGNVQAITRDYPWAWKNEPPNGLGGEYDDAGYIPPGLTYPPQNSWNEALNYGGEGHMRYVQPKEGGPGGGAVNWGVTEGLLTSFGTIGQPGGYPQLWSAAQGFPMAGSGVDGEYAVVQNQPKPYSTWKDVTCTPLTFPNCSMTAMMQSGGEATFYDHKTQNAGRIYAESVNRAYNQAFVSGGVEALRQVNTSEHSTFDPCSGPGLLELLLPLGAAVASVVVYNKYTKPGLSISLGSQIADYGTIVVAGFVYNYSKGLLEYLNDATNIHFERAARFLLYPLGLYGGMQLGGIAYGYTSQSANQQYFTYGGAAVGVLFTEKHLVIPVAKVLSKGSGLAGLLLGLFGAMMRGVSHFWCALSTNQDSCAAMDMVEFQDSRRWDAVSIAAMLTLEVCEREGWTKDSAEAQFVFRGLLTGPGMMTAPMTDNGKDTIFDGTIANPLGYTYAGRWQQLYNGPFTKDTWTTYFQRSNKIYGWDGDQSGWGDLGNSNLYSCENWDVMREGLQQKTHPATKALKRKFDEWIGNWQDPGAPAGKLVAAAKVPANIEAMKHIPGWELEDATDLSFLNNLRPMLQTFPDELEFTPQAGYNSGLRLQEVTPDFVQLTQPSTHLTHYAPVDPLRSRYDPSYCGQVWQDMMQAEGDWAQFDRIQVHNELQATLGVPQCKQSSVEDIGKIFVVRIALSAGTDATCSDLVNYLQHAGWTSDTIDHAVWTVAQVVQSKIPDLAEWALNFLQECSNYSGTEGSSFATLPSTITSKWCA
jgi:hypothetical protein